MIKFVVFGLSTCICACLDIVVGLLTVIVSIIVGKDFMVDFSYKSEGGDETMFWKHTHSYWDSID